MKPTTLVEIAKESRYSTNTVSRYINKKGYISKDAEKAIQRAIDKLKYYPSFSARIMKKAKSNLISMVISSIKNDFYVGLIRGAEEVLVNEGYSIFIFDCKNDNKYVDTYIKHSASFRVDGIITHVSNNTGFEKMVSRLKNDYGMQFVLIENCLEKLNYDFVGFKDEKGASMLVEHLIKKHDRKRIGGVFSKAYTGEESMRFKGYVNTLKKYGIAFNKDLVLFDKIDKLNGYNMTRKLLKRNVDAIFTENTIFGVGAIKAIDESEFKYPDDLSFVTFDDYDINTIFHPHITCLKRIDKKFGRIAAETLLDRINNPNRRKKSIELDVELEIRESCGCKMKA